MFVTSTAGNFYPKFEEGDGSVVSGPRVGRLRKPASVPLGFVSFFSFIYLLGCCFPFHDT